MATPDWQVCGVREGCRSSGEAGKDAGRCRMNSAMDLVMNAVGGDQREVGLVWRPR